MIGFCPMTGRYRPHCKPMTCYSSEVLVKQCLKTVQSNLLNQPRPDAPIQPKPLYIFNLSGRATACEAGGEAGQTKPAVPETSNGLAGRAWKWRGWFGNPTWATIAITKSLDRCQWVTIQGNKKYQHHNLQRRYKHPPIIIQELPAGWIPDIVILEGMFLIQTSPISTMSCMQDYVKLLLSRFVRPHFIAGVKSVHVVFDVPGAQQETPKEIEQYRRDRTADATGNRQHYCTSFSDDLLVPDKWRSILART